MKTRNSFSKWFKISAIALGLTGALIGFNQTFAESTEKKTKGQPHHMMEKGPEGYGPMMEEEMPIPSHIKFNKLNNQLVGIAAYPSGFHEAMAYKAGELPALCNVLGLPFPKGQSGTPAAGLTGVWQANFPGIDEEEEDGGLYVQIQKDGAVGIYMGDRYNCQGVAAGTLQGDTMKFDKTNEGLMEMWMMLADDEEFYCDHEDDEECEE